MLCKQTHYKKTRFALVLIFIFVQSCSWTLETRKDAVIPYCLRSCSVQTPESVDQFPRHIANAAHKLLEDRVGTDFIGRFEFSGGYFINVSCPELATCQWQIPAYILLFRLVQPAEGISVYEIEMWLNQKGELIGSLELPDCVTQPEKKNFVPISQALCVVSEIDGFDIDKVFLIYDSSTDSIIYQFVDNNELEWDYVEINAHDGSLSRRWRSHGIP